MKLKPKKILLIGAPAVGKSSFAKRLKFDSFDGDYKSTIGVQLHEIIVAVDEDEIPLVLWDTDGNFGDAIFDTVYSKGASAAVILGDASRPETLQIMIDTAEAFEDNFPARPSLCLINKTDIVMPSADVIENIQQRTDYVATCSALRGEGILAAIESLTKRIIDRDEM